LEKNKKIKLGLKSKPKVRLKPHVFKLPIERVFADFEKPRSELSKHPFTVRVSKPNSINNPQNAIIKLNTFLKFIISFFKIIALNAKVSNGIGDINTPAKPAFMYISAEEINEKGIAKPKAPSTK